MTANQWYFSWQRENHLSLRQILAHSGNLKPHNDFIPLLLSDCEHVTLLLSFLSRDCPFHCGWNLSRKASATYDTAFKLYQAAALQHTFISLPNKYPSYTNSTKSCKYAPSGRNHRSPPQRPSLKGESLKLLPQQTLQNGSRKLPRAARSQHTTPNPLFTITPSCSGIHQRWPTKTYRRHDRRRNLDLSRHPRFPVT